MTEPEDLDEDLFADLYDGDDNVIKTSPQGLDSITAEPAPAPASSQIVEAFGDVKQENGSNEQYRPGDHDQRMNGTDQNGNGASGWGGGPTAEYDDVPAEQDSHGTGIKEDGKMFIGGLNWETTDQSLKEYFSQFGEVQECTVMRDGASGRSRGFGFLTFRDPKTVNIVMVKEHYLDGKIIDPKRAIPRDEQERTSKIFVGGVSQDATEQDFKEYFMQFGRVVDATLMMDKDTGRPRGFGFVTFDSEVAVEATLDGPLEILGKPIEVKKAQPRGNIRDDDDGGSRRGNRRGGKDNDRYGGNDRQGGNYDSQNNNQNQTLQSGQGMYNSGMTPQMMAQYWQRMQQYFAMMQQQMAASAATQGGMAGPMGMGAMNPAIMQQMQQMQQLKQMQAMQAMARGQQQGSPSPLPQSPGPQAMQGMNPAMMQQIQQMQQMQQMQMQQQQQAQSQPGFGGLTGGVAMGGMSGGAPSISGGQSMGGFGSGRGTPGYNAQEQLMFEQQKYEQQQVRRAAQEARQYQQYQQGGPTSWEGMYDDVPQPNLGGPQGGMGRGMQQGGFGRQMSQGSNGSGSKGLPQQNRDSLGPTPGPQSAPPVNAPTGPKNAGKPGANYRGGGRGATRGFHPYARNQ